MSSDSEGWAFGPLAPPGHKKFMEALKADPSGTTCRATVARHRKTVTEFRDGTADGRMLDMVSASCCRQ